MKHKITATVEDITPEQAQHILDNSETKNRGWRHGNLRNLERGFTMSGGFPLTGESVIFDWNGDLLDGHHRLRICVESGVPFTTVVVRGVDPAMFKYIDSGAGRTAGDINSIAGIPHAKLTAAAAKLVLMVQHGFAIGTFGSKVNEVVTKDDLLDESFDPLYQDAAPFAKLVNKHVKVTESAVAAFYVLAVRATDDRADVEAFLENVINGEGMLRGDPAMAFRRYMFETLTRERAANVNNIHLAALLEAYKARRAGKRFRGSAPKIRDPRPGKPFPSLVSKPELKAVA